MLKHLFLITLSISLAGCSPSKPKKESELRLNMYCEPPSLDSRQATDSTSMNTLLMLFEGLTRIGFDHKPHPALAKKIRISQDQLTYVFKLRRAHWSNGDLITADDFVYAWSKILDPSYPSLFAYKLYPILNAAEIKEGKLPLESLGVRALNPSTLEVTLKFPAPYFLELCAFPTYFPINKKNDLANPDWSFKGGEEYVCNGPFKLETWDHENEIVVKKNPHYWDASSVILETIRLAMINDTATEFYMFEMGELDWSGSPLSNLPTDFIPALKKENKLFNYPGAGIYFYKINTDHFPFGNKKIRKALGLAINRNALVEHVTQGGQMPAMGLIPPMPGWNYPRCTFEDGNKGEAKRLFDEGLKEVGLTCETFPAIKLSYNTNREHQMIAQAIQQQWKEVLGIVTELDNVEWGVYLSKINKQDYQIGRMGWLGDFHDPISFLTPYKFKDNPNVGGNNETGWEHPDYIAHLEAADIELDPIKRAKHLSLAEDILMDEMPIIPLYYINFAFLKKPYVKGVYLSALGFADFKYAFCDHSLEVHD